MKRRVAVTGGGIVSSIGSDEAAIFKTLEEGKNRVRRMEEWEKYTQMNTMLAAPVDFIMPDYPRKKIRGMGRVGQFALVAADNAMKLSALIDNPALTSGRAGVAFGSSMSSVDAMLDIYGVLINNDMKNINATTYIRAMPHTCAVNIEVFYGLTGRIITTNTACTAGSMAIGLAYEAIQNGIQDIIIAGGADELSPVDAAIFDTLFAASTRNDYPELTPAAFDKSRDGLVVGEGAGALVLEEWEHAVKRGAYIFAEVAGFGTNTDGRHVTQPMAETMGGALQLALNDAGINPDLIGYVNMHGTATDAGDIAESHATYDVFKRAVPVSTLKNFTGHTLGACGAVEAWVSILMMNRKWFMPNINLKELDPLCAPLDYITGAGREIDTGYVMTNNFAFGGINTSLIFKKADSRN
ncbi:MAG: beta-ketoacyl-ACP synthase [Treponema sp.]|nr:beta-ketoacyl-ACP synthase [Treponema sp.]